MKPQNLLFDLDDTLIHCNKYFDIIINQFTELMLNWFDPIPLEKEEIKRKQTEFDLAGIHVSGFTAERFPQSFIETYEHFARKLGKIPDPDKKMQLLKLGYSVYDSEFELYPNVIETLQTLTKSGHKLSLFTGGETKIQKAKVEKVNLSPFFEDRVFVAQHKNTNALDGILRYMDFKREHTWMIGNSLRTDILPAIECDIGAVYIPPLSNWAFDLVETPIDKADRLIRLNSIHEVPRTFINRNRQA